MIKSFGTAGIVVIVVLAWILISASCYTLNPAEQAIITQFGDPVGDPTTEPGLHFKTPFVQKVTFIPKQILEWDGQTNEMPTRDKLYISVDTFGRWRIARPLEYFQRLRDERSAQSRLEDILGSETRNAVAKHDLIEIVRTTKERTPEKDETLEEMTSGVGGSIGVLPPIRKGRTKIEDEIEIAARKKLDEFGIELLDVRFKRVNYNPSVVEKIYERMISERQQIASRFRSEGEGAAARIGGDKERDLSQIESEAYRKVEEIQGAADAKASEIYAQAYSQTKQAAEFYRFLQTMRTYRAIIGPSTSMVLSTDSEIFEFLKGAGGDKTPTGPTGATLP